MASKSLPYRLLRLCRPDLKQFVPHGAIMSSKGDRGRPVSNYDECTVLLLSAFFCLTGRTAADDHLRKAIEGALVDLAKVQNTCARSNVVQFCPQRPQLR